MAYPPTKRLIDVVVSAALLSVLLPLFAVIAFLIWLEDRGPVFYGQWRVGQNGQEFRFYKFRSMVVNADALKPTLAAHNEAVGPVFKMRNDPRVTRIGRVLRRYSLDELPQFFNVLCGDMSLVGPRPHLPAEVARYQSDHWTRVSVRPGLICWREVSGRSHLSFEQWMELDLMYLRNRSLTTDLHILVRAVPAIIKGEGAY